MSYLLKNAFVYTGNTFSKLDLLIERDIIKTIREFIPKTTEIQVF